MTINLWAKAHALKDVENVAEGLGHVNTVNPPPLTRKNRKVIYLGGNPRQETETLLTHTPAPLAGVRRNACFTPGTIPLLHT